uniref:Uncharacterized protein n=1 Tax=Rhizophora mucronata TaxID=61149 RepID=A0A2P2PXV4_RHIMU
MFLCQFYYINNGFKYQKKIMGLLV